MKLHETWWNLVELGEARWNLVRIVKMVRMARMVKLCETW